jgi:hypothetical protein
MLHVTQPLFVQDGAGVEVIIVSSSRVCRESFWMIHAQPHATAPVQYSSTVFDKKSIRTFRAPCCAYVEKCFTLVWNTSCTRLKNPAQPSFQTTQDILFLQLLTLQPPGPSIGQATLQLSTIMDMDE